MDTKNKHMSLQDQIEIQECLSKGMTFKAIANRMLSITAIIPVTV